MDEQSFFQTAHIPGVLDGAAKVKAPANIDRDLIAHWIMLIIASKVTASKTHISLIQGQKEFGAKGEVAV